MLLLLLLASERRDIQAKAASSPSLLFAQFCAEIAFQSNLTSWTNRCASCLIRRLANSLDCVELLSCGTGHVTCDTIGTRNVPLTCGRSLVITVCSLTAKRSL